MKLVALTCRILLGLIFVVFGANLVHPFLHMPAPPPDSLMGQFMNVMFTSGWVKVLGCFQVLGGLLVLLGGTLPLGLCILCPLTVNILCIHLFLTGGKGIGMGALTAGLEILLIYYYRPSFAGILSANQKPIV
jgi:putative oxidoreductase